MSNIVSIPFPSSTGAVINFSFVFDLNINFYLVEVSSPVNLDCVGCCAVGTNHDLMTSY